MVIGYYGGTEIQLFVIISVIKIALHYHLNWKCCNPFNFWHPCGEDTGNANKKKFKWIAGAANLSVSAFYPVRFLFWGIVPCKNSIKFLLCVAFTGGLLCPDLSVLQRLADLCGQIIRALRLHFQCNCLSGLVDWSQWTSEILEINNLSGLRFWVDMNLRIRIITNIVTAFV